MAGITSEPVVKTKTSILLGNDRRRKDQQKTEVSFQHECPH